MRILFVTSTRIGDAVLSTGLLRHLVNRHPHARITVACGPAPASLFDTVPGLDRVIVMRKAPRAGHWRSLWRACIGTKWDLVVDLRRSPITKLLIHKQRHVLPKLAEDRRHKVVSLGALLSLDPPPAPHLWLSETAIAQAKHLLSLSHGPETPLLGLGPAANWFAKTWRSERFAALTERLLSSEPRLAGARVALFGAPEDQEHTAPLVAHLRNSLGSDRVLDLVGTPPLPVVAACLAELDLYIGNDSGLMHTAAAVKTPCVGLFGPSRDEHYAPWGDTGLAVRTPESYEALLGPNYDWRNPQPMMDSLTVDAAEAGVKELLNRLKS
ncbi:MAG: glycosyltransferase family 9 protein [Rhodospirillaceae bacterium]